MYPSIYKIPLFYDFLMNFQEVLLLLITNVGSVGQSRRARQRWGMKMSGITAYGQGHLYLKITIVWI